MLELFNHNMQYWKACKTQTNTKDDGREHRSVSWPLGLVTTCTQLFNDSALECYLLLTCRLSLLQCLNNQSNVDEFDTSDWIVWHTETYCVHKIGRRPRLISFTDRYLHWVFKIRNQAFIYSRQCRFFCSAATGFIICCASLFSDTAEL